METSWALHVGDVQVTVLLGLLWKPNQFQFCDNFVKRDCKNDWQAGEGYPGWQQCNPLIPHAKWSKYSIPS